MNSKRRAFPGCRRRKPKKKLLNLNSIQRQLKGLLTESDRRNLRNSGIVDEIIAENGIYSCNNSTELASLLNRSDEGRTGLVFPYRDLDGSPTSFVRVRPHNPRCDKGKPIKYETPVGSNIQPYFPVSSIELIKNEDCPIYIVEGEKKALALSQLGLAVIGVGGVWCFAKKNSEEFLDGLQQIDFRHRTVYIVFDWDVKQATREHVDAAARKLARMLRRVGVKSVRRVYLPPGPNYTKQGVDDFLHSVGVHGFDLLVRAAPEMAVETEPRISSINLIDLIAPQLGEDAYLGPIGEFLRKIHPHTEATDAGILAHLLPALGILIGTGPWIEAGGIQQCRINTSLVGPTSKGRKGTSCDPVERMVKAIAPSFYKTQWLSGLATGEGLIKRVADCEDDGDKRLYVVEPEFSRVLAQTERTGNTLSHVLRQCFDNGTLQVLTRSEPLTADGAHVAFTGHITREELIKRMNETEMVNGFANRILWFYVSSDKVLPFARFPDGLLECLAPKFAHVHNLGAREFRLSPAAMKRWEVVYEELRQDKPGVLGVIAARGSCLVLRMALIYAITRGSDVVDLDDLKAGLAVWQYNVESVQLIFGDLTGNNLSDRILRLLRSKWNAPVFCTRGYERLG